MAHTYLLFDFGSDEEKVQQARHKLESWKQAFRLDKKLQYKLEREQSESSEPAVKTEPAAKSEPEPEPEPEPAKSKSAKGKPKPKAKSAEAADAAENNGPVKLLVRLYFSGHEKLSEQRWLDRIPSEEPFKSASPKVVRESEPDFADTLKQFDTLE
jgi:outer membrane biosynthesis protein TonB